MNKPIMKWVRKETAQACPVHMAIVASAGIHLGRLGYFSKDAVVRDAGMRAVAESIRWDYIREFIQEDQKVELIPLSQSFFTRHRKEEEHLNPEKFLATGFGKKTFGFASVSKQNDHLVIRRVEQRKAITNGVVESFQNFVDKVEAAREVESRKALGEPDTAQLEQEEATP